MTKRALIVDDSKTAQLRLRKMLEKFDVDIDTSASAEEALGYLSYRQPAVIFLDHHMEGMSGLSALKIIKSNPATALIPVVMYTSEQGDVYVGQARALGALDIISKELIQYSSIEKVLTSLGIGAANSDASGDEPEGQVKTAPSDASSVKQNAETHTATQNSSSANQHAGYAPKRTDYIATNDLNKVQAQVGKLFEIHIAKVRQEIEDNTKFLMRRLSKEIQDKSAPKVGAPAAPETPAPDVIEETPELASASNGGQKFLLLLILLAVIFVGYQLFYRNHTQAQIPQQYNALVEQGKRQNDLLSTTLEALAKDHKASSSGPDARVMLDALGWAVNMNPLVPFGSQALDDQRIYMLGELLALLETANFAGTIFIDIHLGDFCVVKSPSGAWMLPDKDSNVEDCLRLSEQNMSVALGEQVSVGFLNYLHSAPVLADGKITIEMASLGFENPLYSYPPNANAVSAGDWNIAAQQNSRLSFSFSPE